MKVLIEEINNGFIVTSNDDNGLEESSTITNVIELPEWGDEGSTEYSQKLCDLFFTVMDGLGIHQSKHGAKRAICVIEDMETGNLSDGYSIWKMIEEDYRGK